MADALPRAGTPAGHVRAAGVARRAGWPALAISAVLLLFFAPALSPREQFGFFDNGRMHVPMKRYVAQELAAGRFPTWNPYAGLGSPLVADPVNGVQHPLNLLLLALPFDLGFKLWVLALYPIAALGAWAAARRLGLGDAPATTAGLLFALSGYVVSASGNMQYLGALAFFPWMIAAGHAVAARATPARAGLAALASGLCAASGDPQGWAIALGLSAAAAVALPPPGVSRRRAAVRSAAAVAAGVVGALPFVLPVLAWIPHSGRSEAFDAIEYEQFNLLPARALELAVPHLFRTSGTHLASALYEAYSGNRLTPFPWALSEYVGIAALALAALGAARRAPARLLLAAAAAFTWMAMGANAGFGQLARHLPLLGNLRYWEKLAVWPALLVALAAAIGLEVLLASRDAARRLAAGAGAAGLVLAALGALAAALPGPTAALLAPASAGAGGAVAAEVARNVRDGLLHAGAIACLLAGAAFLLARGRLPRPALVLAAILVVDVAAANVRAYVLSDRDATRPPDTLAPALRRAPGLQRIVTPFAIYTSAENYTRELQDAWRTGATHLYAAWNVPERVGNLEIYSGMLPVRSNRFWRRAGRRDRLPEVGTWGFGWIYVPPLLGEREEAFLPAARERVATLPSGGVLYRIPARPRAYLAAEVTTTDRRGAMAFALGASGADRRCVVEGPTPPGYAPPRGDARIVEDAAERVVVAAEADRPALLVLNDVYAAGWEASLDGAPAEILPANYLARGVWIPAGRHEVRFAYRTPWLREAWGIAAAGALLLALLELRRRRPKA